MGLKKLTQPEDITVMVACGSLSTSGRLVQKVLDGNCIIADGTALVFPWQTCISMECLYINSGYYALTGPPAPQMFGKIIGIL